MIILISIHFNKYLNYEKSKSNTLLNHFPFIIFLTGFFLLVVYLIVKEGALFMTGMSRSTPRLVGEMMRSKSFFVPLWQGRPWLDKPPIPSLFYGIVELLPFAPEITTRIATLFSAVLYWFSFIFWGLRVTKSKLISLLSIIITAFLPIYFQRSQALNVDVFLFIRLARICVMV